MLKKLFLYFKKLRINTSNKNKNSEFSIVVSLQPNYEIDIKLNYPMLDNIDINSIPNISEKYAELVIYIGSNALKSKLINTIEENSYRSEDMKQKLFFDNLIYFHEFISKEIKNHQNNGPLIRPISVFNVK